MHVGSKGAYLPQWATIEEAASWLESVTIERWPLGRVFDCAHLLELGVWLRPDERTPPEVLRDIFEGRQEGFWASLCFGSDIAALKADRTLVMTMTRIPSGELASFKPGLCFELDDLRIEGGSVRALAESLKPENQGLVGWVRLPYDTRTLEYRDLAGLMAEALASPGESPVITASREIQFEGELNKLVDAGQVPLKNPLTGGAHEFPHGSARDDSIIRVSDLKTFLATHYGLGVLAMSGVLETSTAFARPQEQSGCDADDSPPQIHLKRGALVKLLASEWPDINNHLSEASRNGLKAEAHTGKQGMWDVDKVRAWGKRMGYLALPATANPLQAAWTGQARIHRIED